MSAIAIYGCGGFGREIAPLAYAAVEYAESSEPAIVFVSDSRDEIGKTFNTVPVISFAELKEKREIYGVVIAIAAYHIRRNLADRCDNEGIRSTSLSAITARIVDRHSVTVDTGAILCDQTIITANAKIGRHFQANIYSYVAHDCLIGDFVTLAPKACINGNTVIEDNVYIGTGAVLKQGTPRNPLRGGRNAIVGMGAVVTKNVPPGAVVVGNPARTMN